MLAYNLALEGVWALWAISWFAAARWSGKTAVHKRTDIFTLKRVLLAIGAPLTIAPSAAWWKFIAAFPAAEPAFQTVAEWPTAALIALIGLTALGFVFCWWARIHLGRLWSGTVQVKADHRVVDTGPYGLVRHPIYAGILWSGWMSAAFHATPVAVFGAVLMSIGCYAIARVEESFLREQLGADAYDAYAARVPMLVPFAPTSGAKVRH
jgi:protein-S-isoprenylcysteine O-methyltransferase Ste14